MNLFEFCLLLLAILMSVAGQVYLKLGALKLGAVTFENLKNHVFKILSVPELLLGLGFYSLGAIAYILVLTRVSLSVAAPAASLIYIFTVLSAFLFFNEPITLWKSLGVGAIVFGVCLVASD